MITNCGPDECWFWKTGKLTGGYGRFFRRSGTQVASRIVLELKLQRELFPHEFACHACDNPPCCNPAHIWLGDPKTNMEDCLHKERHFKSLGSYNPRAILTETDIPKIRKMITNGMTNKAIAALRLGKRWTHG